MYAVLTASTNTYRLMYVRPVNYDVHAAQRQSGWHYLADALRRARLQSRDTMRHGPIKIS